MMGKYNRASRPRLKVWPFLLLVRDLFMSHC